jgi:NAD(P)H dehydrogenase (quinone)
MKVLTVISHPRTTSLTFAVANRFVQGLKDAGHETEVLDLHRSGFNPVLWEADEPDWSADDQHYSPEVEEEIERMKQYDALAYIFPLWWWSMPAMLKGYIDRVWNYGFAYGSKKLHHQHVLWLSLAGAPIERFEKRKYDKMMTHYFNVSLADYVGIPNSQFELFYKTIDPSPDHIEELLKRSYDLGLNYAKPQD